VAGPEEALVKAYECLFYNPRVPYRVARAYAALVLRGMRLRRNVAGVEMDLRVSDILQARLLLEGVWEPTLARWWALLSDQSHLTFDVGAHCGFYALYTAMRNAEARVYAFEPNLKLCDDLSRNIRLNGVGAQVAIDPRAITDRAGSITLHLRQYEPATASVYRPPWEYEATIEVPSVSLDEFRAEQAVGFVDLIKVDVEGAEGLVLHGMASGLAEEAYQWIVMETHHVLMPENELALALRSLSTAGYTVLRVLESHLEVVGWTENLRPRDQWIISSRRGLARLRGLLGGSLRLPDSYAGIWRRASFTPR